MNKERKMKRTEWIKEILFNSNIFNIKIPSNMKKCLTNLYKFKVLNKEEIKEKARQRYREQKRKDIYEKKVNDLYGEIDI